MNDELYVTFVLPFDAHGDEARHLLRVARLFRLAVLELFERIKHEKKLDKIYLVRKYRSIAYALLKNRRYADGALDLTRSVILSARALRVDEDDIEFKQWLLFQSEGEKNKGNACISLRENLTFAITIGNRKKVLISPTVSKNYAKILRKLYESGLPYYARVILRRFGERDGLLRIHGELHISIPASTYYLLHGTRENNGKNFGGLDINSDRMNLAIVNRDGKLLDIKTFWFKYAKMRPANRKMVWSDIGEKIHSMLKYAYHHGVKVLFVENLEVLGKLATIWRVRGERKNKDYNFIVNAFRVSVLERIIIKAPLYGIIVKTINPRGTSSSKKHKEIMKKYGLDRHCASAYLIALRGLRRNATI
ncbi:MAG: hypothetical protein ACTSVA_00170 [Candidatus Njordarchaeales archaeon]